MIVLVHVHVHVVRDYDEIEVILCGPFTWTP